MRLTNEAIEQITRSVINYYLETKKRLPTNKEFNATYTDACTDFLVFGYCVIPRDEVGDLSMNDKSRQTSSGEKLSRKERRKLRR